MRADRVDLRLHAETHLGIDPDPAASPSRAGMVKLAITTSSSDSVNASIQPAAIAGHDQRQRHRQERPDGSAAEVHRRLLQTCGRARPSRDCTTTVTKHMRQRGVGDGHGPRDRARRSAPTNNSSSGHAADGSPGITSSEYSMPENSERPLKQLKPRARPIAASVPSSVATVADTAATLEGSSEPHPAWRDR